MSFASETPQPSQWPVPPPPAPQTGILVGPLGLRAGWSIALFVLFFLVASTVFRLGALAATGELRGMVKEQRSAASAQNAGRAPAPAKDATVKDTMVSEAMGVASVFLATLAMAAIERRRFRVFGVGLSRVGDFLPGAIWGMMTLAALIGLLQISHALAFDERLLFGRAAVWFGLKWLVAFFFVGLFEESLTRGYMQYTLMRGYSSVSRSSPGRARLMAFWRAALLMSAIFGLSHLGNRNETALGIGVACLAGLVFSYALWRTGSLWWAIGFHLAWDWAQSFLFGVPDSGQTSAGRLFRTHPTGPTYLSGGIAGPEGSIFVIPVLLLVLVLIRYTTQPGVQPPLAPLGIAEPSADPMLPA